MTDYRKTAERRTKPMKLSRHSVHQEIMAYIFIATPMLLFFTFTCYPVIRAFYLSFTKYDILTPAKWIGLDNYKRLIQDELFFITIRNIFLYVIMYVPSMIILSLTTALALNRIKYANIYLYCFNNFRGDHDPSVLLVPAYLTAV